MQNLTKQCPKCNHHNHKLYYTEKNGREVGHCKHCDYSYSRELVGGYVKHLSSVPKGEHGEHTLPKGFSTDWKDWQPEAVQWVTKYGITQRECSRYKIGMSPTCDRLWLTVWDAEGLAWMQGRALYEGQEPKYLTRFNRQQPFYIELPYYECKANKLEFKDDIVIVEDILSAIKAGRHASAIALCSTSMQDMHLKYICRHKQAIIALDNDNSVVKKQQRKIQKTLDNYIPSKLLLLNKDLKEYKDEEIINLINC